MTRAPKIQVLSGGHAIVVPKGPYLYTDAAVVRQESKHSKLFRGTCGVSKQTSCEYIRTTTRYKYVHTYTHAYIPVHTMSYTYTYEYIHKYIHTYIHTHIHTYQ